jgi:serralysin
MALGIDSTDQVATGGNIYVQSLLNNGWRWDMATNANRTIQYVFDGTWAADERAAIEAVFDAWEQVADIHFEEGTNANAAEIVLHHSTQVGIGGFFGYSGTPFQAENVNGSTETLQVGMFAAVTVVTTDFGRVHTYIAFDSPPMVGGLGSGTPGFLIGEMGFEMILHEIGHALGLKHPHDAGASGSAARFPDSTSATGGITGAFDFGDNRLNQSIYTAMSYNTNYDANAANLDYSGMMAGPMAFDIAAIQQLYGAVARNTGDNTYVLPDATTVGAAWTSIWDTGGNDTIAYDGTVNAVINLTAATLDNSATGGGVPSYTYTLNASGDRVEAGGFTIAGDITGFIPDQSTITGVIIENALGGSGDDEITGNATNNFLAGRLGDDTLAGLAGADTYDYQIGDGTDTIEGFNAAEGDKIDLTDTTFSNFLGLQTLIEQDGLNTKITFDDGGGLVLENVVATSLTADQFLLPDNTAPEILSGAGGEEAIYFVRVNDEGITTLAATDINLGDVISFSIVGGADADKFSIENGALFFNSHPNPANKSYVVEIQASDGQGGVDLQEIKVNVSANKMRADAAQTLSETFVFHPALGTNTISNFDVEQDFLQFDKGMFSSDTAAAVLEAARDTKKGDVVVDVHAGNLTIVGVTVSDLLAHQDNFLFV